MSGEPKTLTLTFQEAVELLGRDYRAALVFLPYSPDQLWDAWSTLSIDEEGYAVEDFAPTWEETMSSFLGVRVVARDEAAELREALRTLVTDLEALMEESHLSLYDGDGALADTSWGKVLQGGKDEYLSNWQDVKRLAGGENEK